ncbi:MAG: hypothetical protein ACJZ8R_00025 [Pseudohongiellaceae bacterium]
MKIYDIRIIRSSIFVEKQLEKIFLNCNGTIDPLEPIPESEGPEKENYENVLFDITAINSSQEVAREGIGELSIYRVGPENKLTFSVYISFEMAIYFLKSMSDFDAEFIIDETPRGRTGAYVIHSVEFLHPPEED